MRDNVTPFRPRKPPPKPKSNFNIASHRGRAVLVQLLTLAAMALNFMLAGPLSWVAWGVGVAAVAIAASNRQSAMPWAATHHEHALRTLVIGFAVSSLSTMLLYVLQLSGVPAAIIAPLTIGWFWLQIAVLIWVAIRAGVGLILAIIRHPIWHPRGILL